MPPLGGMFRFANSKSQERSLNRRGRRGRGETKRKNGVTTKTPSGVSFWPARPLQVEANRSLKSTARVDRRADHTMTHSLLSAFLCVLCGKKLFVSLPSFFVPLW